VSLIENERTKLPASWLNSISAASIAVGGFAQLVPLLGGSPATQAATGWLSAALIALGLTLHVAARRWLGRLRE